MAVATQDITVQMLVALGLISQANATLLNYTVATGSFVSALRATTTINLLASTSNQSFNLATTFPGFASMTVLTLREITSTAPGASVGFSSNATGSRFLLAPRGALVLVTSGALPTLTFDNSNASVVNIEIGILGN